MSDAGRAKTIAIVGDTDEARLLAELLERRRSAAAKPAPPAALDNLCEVIEEMYSSPSSAAP